MTNPEPSPTPVPPAPPADPPGPPSPPVVPPGAHVKSNPEPVDAAELAKLRDELQRARKDAADYRTKLRDTEAKTAKLPEVLKALGIETDETDPAKLAEVAQRERDAAVQAQQAVRRELAIFRLAGAAGAEPNALLDSRSFLDSVATIDPADAAAITDAIKAAVAANARLAAVAPVAPPTPPPVGGQSGGDFTGGPGSGQQLSRAQLHAMSDADILAAYESGRLNSVVKAGG